LYNKIRFNDKSVHRMRWVLNIIGASGIRGRELNLIDFLGHITDYSKWFQNLRKKGAKQKKKNSHSY